MTPPVGEAALGPGLVVDRGEDVRIGEQLAELEEHAFGAAQVEQEVVDERDPQVAWIGARRHAAAEPTAALGGTAQR